MLGKLIEKLRRLTGDRNVIDPSVFNDPVALQTQWTPAKGGGSNFCTHKLVEIDFNRMEFKATPGARVFYLVFFLAGIGIAVAFWLGAPPSFGESGSAFAEIVPFLAGSVFIAAGALMFYFGTSPIVFDKYKGSFWKGRKSQDEMPLGKVPKYFARLTEIHAIQLISEYCRSDKSSYYSYELNLVMRDGKRINVIDHGNVNRIREDAHTLSRFLGRPVWDGIR
jgi:hypothetical protein